MFDSSGCYSLQITLVLVLLIRNVKSNAQRACKLQIHVMDCDIEITDRMPSMSLLMSVKSILELQTRKQLSRGR